MAGSKGAVRCSSQLRHVQRLRNAKCARNWGSLRRASGTPERDGRIVEGRCCVTCDVPSAPEQRYILPTMRSTCP
eukprot:867490-Pyramimonas_sp.AAC.1